MTKLVIEYKGYRNQIEAESDWLSLSQNREDTYGINYTRSELCDYIKHHRGYLSRGDINEALYKFLLTYESVLVDSTDVKNDTHYFYLIIREYPNHWIEWIKDNVKPVAKDVVEHGVDGGQIGSLIYTWEIQEILSQYEEEIVSTIRDYLDSTGFNITLTSKDFDSFDSLMTKLVYAATELEAGIICDDEEDYEEDYEEGEDLEAIKDGANDFDTDLFDIDIN